MTVIKILVETVGSLYIASAYDDVGKLCEANSADRKMAVKKVKKEAKGLVGEVDEWKVEDM